MVDDSIKKIEAGIRDLVDEIFEESQDNIN